MKGEEAKQLHTMREVASWYGFQPNRGGYICCPFHREKTASMKLYDYAFHCYGCGAHGDTLDFIQKEEGISFSEAMERMGAESERMTRLAAMKASNKAANAKAKEERRLRAIGEKAAEIRGLDAENELTSQRLQAMLAADDEKLDESISAMTESFFQNNDRIKHLEEEIEGMLDGIERNTHRTDDP